MISTQWLIVQGLCSEELEFPLNSNRPLPYAQQTPSFSCLPLEEFHLLNSYVLNYYYSKKGFKLITPKL